MARVSVILAFYNRIDYLELVLAGFDIQTRHDFEIIIADDGSSPEVVARIGALTGRSPYRIRHVWHEDRGFRKTRILNRAVEKAGEYLIFVDADCIPHPDFVRDHVERAAPGACLSGRRVNLSERFTRRLTPERVRSGYLQKHFARLVLDGLFGGSSDVEKGILLRRPWARALLRKRDRGLLGCNFSLHRETLLAVNGFDERYEKATVGEDSDLDYRLRRAGTRVVNVNHLAVQYHLYHRPLSRAHEAENYAILRQTRDAGISYTPYGLRREDRPP